jgi:hypothetical protein
MSGINPRYGAYLKTTRSPTNWDFMSFIRKMKDLYMVEFSVSGNSIDNQDKFTQFIIDEVWL